jgi:UDP-N-acetylmuramate dehydrogenase
MKLIKDADLKKYNTYRLGGIAKLLLIVEDIDELFLIDKNLLKEVVILGGGSNVLISDELGDRIFMKMDFKGKNITENDIEINAGENLTEVAIELASQGYRDFLNYVGIPGTVGGAVVMNSGTNKSISEIITKVVAITRDKDVKILSVEDINYGYRDSIFQKNDLVVLSTYFKAEKGEPVTREEIEAKFKERMVNHPLAFPSAGCWFKGAFGCSDIVRETGFVGKWISGAVSSPLMPAFILNVDSTPQDIYLLAKKIKDKAEEIGKPIEFEIKLIGDFNN